MSKTMKLSQCDREQEVVDALRSRRWATAWGNEIRQHAESCEVCAEVAFAAQAFQHEVELAKTELDQPGTRLPSAGLVWWKAQLAARRAAEHRAVAPMVWVERAACVLGAFAALGLAVWKWPLISAWLFRAGTSASTPRYPTASEYSITGAWLHSLAQVWTSQSASLLLAATAAAFFTLMIFAAYVVWREE
jgi:cytoskeletal protein RodZ